MTEPYLADAFRRLQVDLRAVGVRWALVGGLAVSARAEPRTTRDIDIVVAVASDREAEEVVVKLRQRGYLDRELMEHRDVDRLATVRLTRRGGEPEIYFDLLFASSGIENEVVAEADLLEVLPGLFSPVAGVHHLLALKVLALRKDRPHDRPQDATDIRELLRVASAQDVQRARRALELISRRGFDRGKELQREIQEQLVAFRRALKGGA